MRGRESERSVLHHRATHDESLYPGVDVFWIEWNQECGILRFDGKRGKAEQKSADGTVYRNRPHSRKMAPLNQVLFRLSLSGAQQYSHPEEGRWKSWDILWREKSSSWSTLRPCQTGDFTHFIFLNSTRVTDNYTECCQTDWSPSAPRRLNQCCLTHLSDGSWERSVSLLRALEETLHRGPVVQRYKTTGKKESDRKYCWEF